MRKKMFSFKNFVMLFMAIGLLTSVGCSKQDNSNEEVDNLKKEVATLKADLLKNFQTEINAKTKDLQDQLNDAKAKLKELSDKQGVTSQELEAAKQDVLSKAVTVEAFKEYKESMKAKIEAADSKEAIDALDDKVKDAVSKISVLETTVGKNKADLEEALKSLRDEFSGSNASMDKAIKDLEGKIEAASTGLKDMLKNYKDAVDASVGTNADAIKDLNTKFDNLVKNDLGIEVASLLNNRLTSLVLLPDYVADKGGALPILNFSPLKTDNCGEIVPAVVVRYVVNPSTVTKKDIDTLGLKFRYNDPKIARKSTAGVDQKAEFVSLEDGILTVKATLSTEKLWDSKKVNLENRIDQLMLEVPVAGSNAVVSSDWAKVISKPQELAIVKKPKTPRHTDAEPWKLFELKRYVHQNPGSHPKDETVTEGVVVSEKTKDYTVVDMEYDKDLDISKYVQSMYKLESKELGSVIDLEKYGLRFEFDLINHETKKPIIYNLGPKNNTDQQEFIKFKDDKKTLTTKVYTKDRNRAAVDKTPIVHVMLVRGEGDDRCVAREGYIKINIIEKEIPVVEPVVYKKAIEAKCGKHEVYRVKTQEMNESFYHKVNMTKEEFHKKYKFTAIPHTTDVTNVGTVTQVVDEEATDSYNLIYTISEADVWKNIGKTAWAEGEYKYGTHTIKVRFEAPITKETVKLDITLDNYWYNGYANIVHNVAVPDTGSTASNTCTWENNINSAFKTYNKVENLDDEVNTENPHKDKFNLLHLGFRQDKKTMERYNTYTYVYKFFKTQPELDVVKYPSLKGIELSVTPDGKELRAKRGTTVETIAKIKAQDGAAGTGKGDPLEYMEDSKLGKELLNAGPEAMKATVELIVKNSCGHRVNVEVKNLPKKDKFDIHFLRPVNVEGRSGEDFVDAVDFGSEGSYIDMKQVARLSDWRNYIKDTHKYDFMPNNENFYQYYGVTDIKVDIDAIKVEGLKVSGKDVDRLTTDIRVNQTPNNETFTNEKGVTKVYEYGRLTYKNNGANLKEPFIMYVPVTVTYKWGEVVATVVEITVNPSSKTARKAAK